MVEPVQPGSIYRLYWVFYPFLFVFLFLPLKLTTAFSLLSALCVLPHQQTNFGAVASRHGRRRCAGNNKTTPFS